MLVAVVPVAYTRVTCTGIKEPPSIPVNVTVSPPTVSTVKLPAPPTYNTQPLLLVPPVIDGMSTVFDGVTAAARPT